MAEDWIRIHSREERSNEQMSVHGTSWAHQARAGAGRPGLRCASLDEDSAFNLHLFLIVCDEAGSEVTLLSSCDELWRGRVFVRPGARFFFFASPIVGLGCFVLPLSSLQCDPATRLRFRARFS